MSRKISTIASAITPVTVEAAFAVDPAGWLLAQAQTHQLKYLLAHADDGVIWGKVEPDSLWLSGNEKPAVSPPLRAATLQQARLFGSNAELMLWRVNDGWSARLITDSRDGDTLYYDEKQILWGNNRLKDESNDNYTVTADGEQGFRQIIPLPSVGEQFANKNRPFYLMVRHYLTRDETSGLYRVTLSRLTNLNVEDAK